MPADTRRPRHPHPVSSGLPPELAGHAAGRKTVATWADSTLKTSASVDGTPDFQPADDRHGKNRGVVFRFKKQHDM